MLVISTHVILGMSGSTVFKFNYSDSFVRCNEYEYNVDIELIHLIGHYNPSVRIIDPVSHTTYVVCVNVIHKWRDLQFRLRTTDFKRNFSLQFYLLSEFLPEVRWEEIAEEILFVFCFDVWPEARTLAFRLISLHTIY